MSIQRKIPPSKGKRAVGATLLVSPTNTRATHRAGPASVTEAPITNSAR
jgi:hypothetical protein